MRKPRSGAQMKSLDGTISVREIAIKSESQNVTNFRDLRSHEEAKSEEGEPPTPERLDVESSRILASNHIYR